MFKAKHPTILNVITNSNLTFNLTSDSILLINSNSIHIDSLVYNDQFPWPDNVNGTGFTLSLIKPYLENSDPVSWDKSYIIGGTPGEPNEFNPTEKGIIINELMASNSNTVQDESNDFDDWIEIYNSADRAIDITGLYITDDLNLKTKYRVPYADSNKNIIPSKKYKLLWADNEPIQGLFHLNFTLDANGEQFGLISKNGKDIIDSINFPASRTNISYGRKPLNNQKWDYLEPTPLSLNKDLIIENIIANNENCFEIFPNPATSSLTIRIPVSEYSSLNISIFTILGQLVYTEDISNEFQNLKTINISDFNKGLYLIKIKLDDQLYTSKIIIK